MSHELEPIPVLAPEPGKMMRAPLTSTPVDPFSGRPRGPKRIIQHDVPAVRDNTPVPDGTFDEVLHWVDGSPERAAAATLEELGRDKPRRTLLNRLQGIGK